MRVRSDVKEARQWAARRTKLADMEANLINLIQLLYK